MPDETGNIKGIALTGKAGETLDRIGNRRIGYKACWKLIRSGRNPIYCRMPKDHDGPCIQGRQPCVKH